MWLSRSSYNQREYRNYGRFLRKHVDPAVLDSTANSILGWDETAGSKVAGNSFEFHDRDHRCWIFNNSTVCARPTIAYIVCHRVLK